MMYCPRCGKKSVISKDADQWEQMEQGTYWKKTEHVCGDCCASFINYDDGEKARKHKEEQQKKLDERNALEELRNFKQLTQKAVLHKGLNPTDCKPRQVEGVWYIEVNTHLALGKVLLLDKKHSLPIPLRFESEGAAQAFINQGGDVEDESNQTSH